LTFPQKPVRLIGVKKEKNNQFLFITHISRREQMNSYHTFITIHGLTVEKALECMQVMRNFLQKTIPDECKGVIYTHNPAPVFNDLGQEIMTIEITARPNRRSQITERLAPLELNILES